MGEMDEQETAVIKIDVERDRGVTLVFADGLELFFANDDLRVACPCATCRGVREQGQEVRADGVRVVDAHVVGAWGLGILWSDGHATGIYPFEALRRSAGEE